MIASARARFSGGVLHPLEPLDLVEGEEVIVSIQAVLPQDPHGEAAPHESTEAQPKRTEEERKNRMMSTAGAWKGKIDGEAVKRILYEARRTGSRETPGS